MDQPVGKELLQEMIEAIGRSAADLTDIPLTGFLAMRGAAYCGEMMWVGRAVNGWTEKGWSPSELRNRENVAEFIEMILSSVVVNPNSCPLRWVTEAWGNKEDYNSARSAFWRVAKNTVLHNNENDQNWSSRLVWSNLYKIAPFQGGNPDNRLAAIQLPFCRELLIQEITAFRPRRVVFATGTDWADDFLDHTRFVRSDPKAFGQTVLGFGDLVLNDESIGKFVIAPHPQGKGELQWVREVRAAFDFDAT